jgi:hypothetical protein
MIMRPMHAFTLTMALLALVPSATRSAAPPLKFPLVFSSEADLAKVGLAHLEILDTRSAFKAKCYFFGEGGPPGIAMSEDILASYVQQGFSQRSLCLGLISGIRFNPESGHRLATYVLIYDLKALRKSPEDAGVMSPELPLALPTCFARALPYTDCAWNYDPISGKKLATAARDKAKKYGAQFEQMITGLGNRALGNHCLVDGQPTGNIVGMYCSYDDLWLAANDQAQSNMSDATYDLLNGSHARYYDRGADFPKGFGYALVYYDTGLGSSASAELVKAALAGAKQKPQIDPGKVKELLKTGTE